jgi:membrane associated rhomboid family serine protease
VKSSEPLFNVPAVVLAVVGLLTAIHAARLLLPPPEDMQMVLELGFVPARVVAALGGDPLQTLIEEVAAHPEDGALASRLEFGRYIVQDEGGLKPWTFLTYAFLHGNWTHLLINGVWLLAFGTAVARRFETRRFLLFLVITAIGGAVGHLLARPDEFVPMIGASAAISGCMAAAIRFVFQPGAPLGPLRAPEQFAYRLPALPLGEALRDSRVLTFLAVWFGINLLTGVGGIALGMEETAIAWEAHVGGFLTGLVCFPLFDPKPLDIV